MRCAPRQRYTTASSHRPLGLRACTGGGLQALSASGLTVEGQVCLPYLGQIAMSTHHRRHFPLRASNCSHRHQLLIRTQCRQISCRRSRRHPTQAKSLPVLSPRGEAEGALHKVGVIQAVHKTVYRYHAMRASGHATTSLNYRVNNSPFTLMGLGAPSLKTKPLKMRTPLETIGRCNTLRYPHERTNPGGVVDITLQTDICDS